MFPPLYHFFTQSADEPVLWVHYTSFLHDAAAHGQRLFLRDQQQGKRRSPAHLLCLAQDWAALALHQELNSQTLNAHSREASELRTRPEKLAQSGETTSKLSQE